MTERSILANLEPVEEKPMDILADKKLDSLQNKILVPAYGSTDWSEYVLSLLSDDEKIKGYPTCVGLRRIAEELLGEFIFTGPIEVFPSTDADGIGRATVIYEIRIAWKLNVEEYVDLNTFEYPLKVFRDVGEAWKGNTPAPFDVHAAASASTKAEGRCLRKALKLKVATAEEMQADSDKVSPLVISDKATSFQKTFIKTKCAVLGIDITKFVPKDLNDLMHSEAVTYLEQLQNFTKDNTSIPKEIKL